VVKGSVEPVGAAAAADGVAAVASAEVVAAGVAAAALERAT
jgi:hypothetical protein